MACITESGFDTNISQVLKVLDLKIPTFLLTHELRLICSVLPMSWSHFGRMSVKLLAESAAHRGQRWPHSMSPLSSPGGRTRVQWYLLLTDSGSFLVILFRPASLRTNASCNERRIRASNHALS